MMNDKHTPTEQARIAPRRPYARPVIERVDLALEETLSSGCKLGSDAGCIGPPVQGFEGGS